MSGLADALARMDEGALRHLLAVRPDLASLPPRSFGQLADLAQRAPSVQACLLHLDRFALETLELWCLAGGTATVERAVNISDGAVKAEQLEEGVERLAALGLAWKDGSVVHVVDAAHSVFTHPFGLGRAAAVLHTRTTVPELTAILQRLGVTATGRKAELLDTLAGTLSDPRRMAGLRKEAPADARRILDAVIEQRTPVVRGAMDMYYASRRNPTGAPWLIQRGVLVQTNWSQGEVPGEVIRALRGGSGIELHPEPPSVAALAVDQEQADRAGAEAGALLVDRVDALIEEWSARPATLLKSGGVGVRDVRRTAKRIDVDEQTVFRIIELAGAAALVGEVDDEVLPSAAADEWRAKERAEQWLDLVDGWMWLPRSPSLAGAIDHRDKPIAALHPDGRHDVAVARRSAVIAALHTVEPGSALDQATVGAWIEHRAPRLWAGGPALPQQMITWVLEEAALVGAIALGTVTTPMRELVARRGPEAMAAARALLPPEVMEFTLQADLTAVVPGRIAAALESELVLMADIESTGAATVLRFSEGSVRRALDAGRSPSDLTSFLEQHATRGVPQPLAYLIADCGRRHGRLRVGQAMSFVRSDDPTLVAEVLASRRTAALGLRPLAPTVLASTRKPGELLDGLRVAGYLPVEESADGAVVTRRPAPRRAATPRRPGINVIYPMVDLAAVEDAVAALRAAPKGKKARPAATVTDIATRRPVAASSPATVTDVATDDEMIELLMEAADVVASIEIGYINARGEYQDMIVEPIDVGPRFMTAAVLPSYKEQTFTLSRVQWARPVAPEEAWNR